MGKNKILLILFFVIFTPFTFAVESDWAAPIDAPPEIQKRVDAFLKEWLKAQNLGNFVDYESLYHSKFSGTRRSGGSKHSMTRKAWMEDRKEMFQTPMTVEIAKGSEEIMVSSPPKGSEFFYFYSLNPIKIKFDQLWGSGNYRDFGSKEMTLVKDGAKLKILKEELLKSTRLPNSIDGRFLKIKSGSVDLDSHPFTSWGKGSLGESETVKSGNAVPATQSEVAQRYQDVDKDKLPAWIQNWQNKKLTVYDGLGAKCLAEVERLQIVFETFGGHAVPDTHSLKLVGLLNKNCASGIWGYDPSITNTTYAPFKTYSGPLTEIALKSWIGTAESKVFEKKIQSQSNLETSAKCTKSLFKECIPVKVTAALAKGPQRSYLTVSLIETIDDNDTNSKTYVGGDIWLIYEIGSDGKSLISRNKGDSGPLTVLGVIETENPKEKKLVFKSLLAGDTSSDGGPYGFFKLD